MDGGVQQHLNINASSGHKPGELAVLCTASITSDRYTFARYELGSWLTG
jgi:hypothetical protein